MMDPELAAMVDLLPQMDLTDPSAARRAFDELIGSISFDIPGIEALEIDDRMVPGADGDPDVPVRVYRPVSASVSASAANRCPGSS